MGGAPGLCGCRVWRKHFEGVLRGPEADAIAVAGNHEAFDLRVFLVGEADVDEADGLAGVRAVGDGRAGDAGDAETERSFRTLADAFSKGARNFGADRAFLLDELGGDFAKVGF